MERNEQEENFMLEVDSLENFGIWPIHPMIFEVLLSIFFSLPLCQCLLLFCVKVYIDTEGFDQWFLTLDDLVLYERE